MIGRINSGIAPGQRVMRSSSPVGRVKRARGTGERKERAAERRRAGAHAGYVLLVAFLRMASPQCAAERVDEMEVSAGGGGCLGASAPVVRALPMVLLQPLASEAAGTVQMSSYDL